MKRFLTGSALLALIALAFTGCGGGSSSSSANNSSNAQAHVFVTGEDAPVSSVVAFNITINQISLNNSSTSVIAMNTPTAVDFGRLVGLRSLLGFNAIAPGTYTSATITFASTSAPTIDYINLTTNPPSLGTATGVLSNSTVTVSFPSGSPLVVGSSGLAGLHIDFDLGASLAISNGNLVINNNGQVAVTPVLDVQAVSASSDLGQITEFTGNVVSVNTTTGTSFVMQGPYGFQETIDVNSSTQYNGTNTFASLVVNGIVDVEGTVQADGSILAASVELITTDPAFLGGRILAISPGPVLTMFVGEELGTSATIPVDSVQTVNLSQVSSWDICFIDNWFTNELFGPSYLVVGQRIFVGGTYQNNSFTPEMVSLRRQGVLGALVENSVNTNLGSFEMQNNGLLSYAANGPFPVATDSETVFVNINGIAGLQSAGAANLVVTGLVFDNPQNFGTPVVWAHRVRVLP
ncbi:MAG TPA: DUF4382 domain-containing protein [Terriglobales bacterium]|nr:DUF4382 domain-containing protein [Terriglobales bacterium]